MPNIESCGAFLRGQMRALRAVIVRRFRTVVAPTPNSGRLGARFYSLVVDLGLLCWHFSSPTLGEEKNGADEFAIWYSSIRI
jgi:hypothetical protein